MGNELRVIFINNLSNYDSMKVYEARAVRGKSPGLQLIHRVRLTLPHDHKFSEETVHDILSSSVLCVAKDILNQMEPGE